jgi:DNA-binding beta-propeller fold protein YncE
MTTTTDGHLFVADAGGHEVFVFKGNQLVQTVAISQSNLYLDPQGVAIGPDGNLVVTNFNGSIISLSFANGYESAYTNASLYSTILGARAGAIFGADDSLYVSTSPNGSAIYKVPSGGGTAVNFGHNYLPYPFGNSRGLAWLPDGTLLVADAGWQGTGLVYKLNINDGVMTPFITGLGGADYIAVLPDDGEILIAEFSANRVSKYDFQGVFLGNFLTNLSAPGVLAYSEQDFAGVPEPSNLALLIIPLTWIIRRWRKT